MSIKKREAPHGGASLFSCCFIVFAEREGFEPSVQLPVQRFSRPSRSTTPASFLRSFALRVQK